MSDTVNGLYEEIIHCTVLNEHIGSADLVALFFVNGHNLLRMGLAETWLITRTSGYEAPKTILTY